jgi:hypothetical protein
MRHPAISVRFEKACCWCFEKIANFFLSSSLLSQGRAAGGRAGLTKKGGQSVRLLTAGLYYINAASNSALVPKVTKSLSGIASAPNVTALDLEPLGRPRLPPATLFGFLAFLLSSMVSLWSLPGALRTFPPKQLTPCTPVDRSDKRLVCFKLVNIFVFQLPVINHFALTRKAFVHHDLVLTMEISMVVFPHLCGRSLFRHGLYEVRVRS